MAKKKKPFKVEMIFDDKDMADCFFAYWLDGGGEQHCTVNSLDNDMDQEHIDTYDWDINHKWLKVKRTGYIVE